MAAAVWMSREKTLIRNPIKGAYYGASDLTARKFSSQLSSRGAMSTLMNHFGNFLGRLPSS
jgi:hypothetical protein